MSPKSVEGLKKELLGLVEGKNGGLDLKVPQMWQATRLARKLAAMQPSNEPYEDMEALSRCTRLQYTDLSLFSKMALDSQGYLPMKLCSFNMLGEGVRLRVESTHQIVNLEAQDDADATLANMVRFTTDSDLRGELAIRAKVTLLRGNSQRMRVRFCQVAARPLDGTDVHKWRETFGLGPNEPIGAAINATQEQVAALDHVFVDGTLRIALARTDSKMIHARMPRFPLLDFAYVLTEDPLLPPDMREFAKFESASKMAEATPNRYLIK